MTATLKTRTFKRIGYREGAYHVRLFEDGKYLGLEAFGVEICVEICADGTLFRKRCDVVKKERDKWLRKWVASAKLNQSK